MRTFPHFNPTGGAVCPICGTNEDKEIVLIPIGGTQVGWRFEAAQVHTECIETNWFYLVKAKMIGIACSSPMIKLSEEPK